MTSLMVLGIGNELGGDDGIGNFVARAISLRLPADGDPGAEPDIIAIDAGTVPESFTSVIRQSQPDLLVFVDAADMGLPPGSVRLVGPQHLKTLSFSTHSMPLSALLDYVGELCGRVLLLGIQPAATGMEQGLSAAVQQAGEQVAEIVLSGRIGGIEKLE